jgi:4-amino-4-deoxy-L-arabinose transferase-like glycosyltransferase
MPDFSQYFRRRELWVFAVLILFAATFRIFVAHHWPNDSPDDSKTYARIARNVLEQHSYSDAEAPPYEPTLIRLPGYPLFLAAVYKVFGHGNNGAVRIVQALIETATCGLIALLAFYWEPDKDRKRAAAIAALALAAVCPFTAIYSATVLTEVPTMFLAVAMCVAATVAFRKTFTTEDTEEAQKHRGSLKKALKWWLVAGLLGGLAVLIRPDSGLFVAAIGLTLVLTALRVPTLVRLFARGKNPTKVGTLNAGKDTRRLLAWPVLLRTLAAGSVFSIAFILVLVPWTIRNARVFHRFQPLAPAHGEMPDEFVPRGYYLWLRSWLDDERYVAPFLWSLDTDPITMDDVPPHAFDSRDEKNQVEALLEEYNHPGGSQPPNSAPQSPQPGPTPPASPTETPPNSARSTGKPTPDSAQKNANANANAEDTGDENDQNSNSSDQADETDNPNESAQSGPEPHGPVAMTPEIDAAFAQIARERIARHPFRYYVWLPVARAETMWFNTHSQYWPFEGDLLPFEDLDYAGYQHIWLPLFAGLTGLYSLLGGLGGWLLWRSRKLAARRWLLLALLIIFLRLAFFATLENPEPRYVVEFFPFLSILGGTAISHIPHALKRPQMNTDKPG